MNKVYVQPIAKALVTNTSLRWLRLSRNRLQCQDVESLFYALQTNRTLRVLDLNSNGIGDQGVPMLASSLSKAQGLRELHLLKNEIRSLQSSSAILQTLQESNRTLEVLELRPSLPQLSRIRYELALNAGGRRILSSGAYTNQVPLGLWPKILERTSMASVGVNMKLRYEPDTLFHMLLQASSAILSSSSSSSSSS